MKRVIRRRSRTDNKNEQGPFFKKDKDQQSFFGKSADGEIPVSKSDAPSEKQADRMANQYIADVRTQPEEASSVQNEEKEKLQAQSDDNKREEEEIVQSKTEEISEEEKMQSKTEEVSEEEKDKEVQTKTEEVTEEKEREMVQTQTEDKEEEDMVQSKGANEPEKEEDIVQSKGEDATAPSAVNNFSQKLSKTKGKGNPLPPSLNEEMTEYFGRDFSAVRIHTGEMAARLCRQIGAQAFTHGNDIYFNEGKYKPDTSEGRHLLVHELTHVVQQDNS